jgi:hypothetical protein
MDFISFQLFKHCRSKYAEWRARVWWNSFSSSIIR